MMNTCSCMSVTPRSAVSMGPRAVFNSDMGPMLGALLLVHDGLRRTGGCAAEMTHVIAAQRLSLRSAGGRVHSPCIVAVAGQVGADTPARFVRHARHAHACTTFLASTQPNAVGPLSGPDPWPPKSEGV